MDKVWYKLIFIQKSALHIGIFNFGVLSETRIFIPGWTMWGALVNRYGQYRGGKEEDFEEGKQIFESITCFYPKLNSEIMFPKFKNGEFCLGNYSENEFRAKFTDVYLSTAIKPTMLTTKDESLHEIEVIIPKSKLINSEKDKGNLYWEGLLGVDNDKIERVEDFLEKGIDVIVGGDSRYGLGNMRLHELKKISTANNNLKEWNIKENGEYNSESKELKNFFAVADGYFNEVEENDNMFNVGKIENVITKLDFSNAVCRIERSKICIVPGSILNYRYKNSNYKLKKGIFLSYM